MFVLVPSNQHVLLYGGTNDEYAPGTVAPTNVNTINTNTNMCVI